MTKAKSTGPATPNSTPNSMVAAATRLTPTPSLRKSTKSTPGWAARAWEFYDLIGEFRYAADWVGSMISKAELYVADEDGNRVAEGPAPDILASLYGGTEGQSEMLKACGTHLTVAGECYLVGTTTEHGTDRWWVVAASELTARGGRYYISKKQIESADEPFVMRLWRPHPRKYGEATAPSRAVLGILAEILGLTKHVAAQVDSRLTGSGVLLLPSELTFPARPNTTGDSTRAEGSPADQFVQMFMDIAAEAIENPESAEARVPFVVTAPGDQIGNAKLLQFWSELDKQAIELRTEAIRRLALGLDLPPDVLTGMADMNHWNAWAVDEASIKVHAEPLLTLVTSSLSEGFLRPLLIDDGMAPEEAARLYVAADTSSIRLRPNRSEEAIELYDRGQLSAVAVRRETGFDESDAMSDEEKSRWLLAKAAQGSTTPEIVAQAMALLGAPITVTEADVPVTEARPTPSLQDHPRTDPPALPGVQVGQPPSDALVAACEQMVFRALERAGNRLKTRLNGTRPPGVAAAELYLFVPVGTGTCDHLLTDAWSHVPRFCDRFDVAPPALVQALDSYCRALLTEQKPHDVELMTAYLSLACHRTNDERARLATNTNAGGA